MAQTTLNENHFYYYNGYDISLYFYFTEQDLHELGPGLNPRSTYLKRKGMISYHRTSYFNIYKNMKVLMELT